MSASTSGSCSSSRQPVYEGGCTGGGCTAAGGWYFTRVRTVLADIARTHASTVTSWAVDTMHWQLLTRRSRKQSARKPSKPTVSVAERDDRNANSHASATRATRGATHEKSTTHGAVL